MTGQCPNPATLPAGSSPTGESTTLRLLAVAINYRTPELVLNCVESLEGELDPGQDRVVVVDNASGDGSADKIEAAISARGWDRWVRLIRSQVNGGFSAGNNLGMQSADAEFYLLINSDAIVRRGAIASLLHAMHHRTDAGIISPRLEWPDGTPQMSCFRNRTPGSEMLAAASTGPLTKLMRAFNVREVAMPIPDGPIEPAWTSFACVLIRRTMLEQIGPMDERYFMYLEDNDYCRRARRAGWTILHWPAARVVHLRHGLTDSARERRPNFYYSSRARYFARHYGIAGLWLANLLWMAGRAVSLLREAVGNKNPHTCKAEWRDIWTNWPRPMKNPAGRGVLVDRPDETVQTPAITGGTKL